MRLSQGMSAIRCDKTTSWPAVTPSGFPKKKNAEATDFVGRSKQREKQAKVCVSSVHFLNGQYLGTGVFTPPFALGIYYIVTNKMVSSKAGDKE